MSFRSGLHPSDCRESIVPRQTKTSVRPVRPVPEPFGQEKFVQGFVAAWTKEMNLDRFDLA
jgi:hypothetical protein